VNLGRIDQALKRLGPKRVGLISLIMLGIFWFLYYLPGDGAAGTVRDSRGTAGRVSPAAEDVDRVNRPVVSDAHSRSQADPAAAAALEQRNDGRSKLSAKRPKDEAEESLVKQ
jgi:hypothetical protein